MTDIFTQVYQSQAAATKDLLRQVHPTFASDVVNLVYNIIWQENTELSLNERALIAVTALYHTQQLTALTTLLNAYFATLLDSDKKIPAVVEQSIFAIAEIDPESSAKLKKHLVHKTVGSTEPSNENTTTTRSEHIADLAKCIALPLTTDCKHAIMSATNGKLSSATIAAIIQQTLPYCGLRCVLPAMQTLLDTIPSAQRAIDIKIDIIDNILQLKQQDLTLSLEERSTIAHYCLSDCDITMLAKNLFLEKDLTNRPQQHDPFNKCVLLLTQNQLEKGLAVDMDLTKKRAILNYMWLFCGCPNTWQGHSILNGKE